MNSKTPEFPGRVALVTGAGQGMGFAIARRLGLGGARVAVNDVRKLNAAIPFARKSFGCDSDGIID